MGNQIERAEVENVHPFSTQPAVQRYVFASNFIENKIVLDIACGIGYGSDILKNEQPSAFVIGGDSYFSGLNYGKRVYQKDLKFCQLNALDLPFKDSSLDIVVSMETIEHILDVNGFLKEIYRILNKDGLFICSTPNKQFTARIGVSEDNPFHVKEFYHDELTNNLSVFFYDIKFYGQSRIASGFMYKFPRSFKFLKILHKIIAPILRKKDPKVYSVKTLNPKYEVKKFWPEAPTMIFVCKKISK